MAVNMGERGRTGSQRGSQGIDHAGPSQCRGGILSAIGTRESYMQETEVPEKAAGMWHWGGQLEGSYHGSGKRQ